MKSIQVTVRRYRCDYCQCLRSSAASGRKHEIHCFKRADRIPHEGEMSDASSSDEETAWEWPGSSMIFHDGKWIDIPKGTGIQALLAMKPVDRIWKLFPTVPHGIALEEPVF